jgi:hypothetical protein
VNRHTPMAKADDTRETPPGLFRELDHQFYFDLDGCASHTNALCPMYCTEEGTFHMAMENGIPYRDRERAKISDANGLTPGAWKGRRVFFNPPFMMIREFVNAAWFSEADLVVGIVPSTRTEQPWWHEYIEPYRDGRADPALELPFDLTTGFMKGRKHFLIDGKPIMRKNRDGSLWLDQKTGLPQRSSPKFGMVKLIWTPTRKDFHR